MANVCASATLVNSSFRRDNTTKAQSSPGKRSLFRLFQCVYSTVMGWPLNLPPYTNIKIWIDSFVEIYLNLRVLIFLWVCQVIFIPLLSVENTSWALKELNGMNYVSEWFVFHSSSVIPHAWDKIESLWVHNVVLPGLSTRKSVFFPNI